MSSSKSKKAKKYSKKWGVIGIFLMCMIMIAFLVYYFYARSEILSSNQSTDSVKIKPYKGGPGGDPKLVTDYRDEAVKLWESGKKEEAKVVARKGIDENKRLTVDQQGQVPGQMSKIYDLYDITIGSYIGE